MQTSAFMDGIRSFFIVIDGWLYSFIGFLYELITSIATTELIETVAIDAIANKLYSFIGIFMLFKVSFSLINYIINPDSITDKEKGGSKMIINIVVTFVLIIITPFGFDLLREAQSAIIEDNVLPRIILNTEGESPSPNEFIISLKCLDYNYPYVTAGGYYKNGNPHYNAGEYIAMMTIRPFFQINPSANSDQIEDLFYSYKYCSATDIDSLLTERIVNHPSLPNKDAVYTVNYTPLIPTVIGVILTIIFIGFVLDIALRTVKLSFLEIIAPIPIMSYIEPSSAKKGLFNKWLKEVGVTWADLFLRLAAIYFAIYLISTIKLFSDENGFWINLFLILGILMFAKKLPDILKKLFNIDVKGNFKLNPLKKIKDDALGGKFITGVATGATAATLGGLTSFRGNTVKERFSNAGKGIVAGMKGGFKDPVTLKGLNSGRAPYKELRKKEKEEKIKAQHNLDEYDRKAKLGKKLLKQAFVYDENGNHVRKMEKYIDENGQERERESREYKIDDSRVFRNSEYIDSFRKVDSLKGAKIKAENNAESKRVLYSDAITKHGEKSVEAMNALLEFEASKKEAASATSKYDLAVKQHDELKKIYKDDAEREEALSFYKKTYAEELLAPSEDNNKLDTGSAEETVSQLRETEDSEHGSEDAPIEYTKEHPYIIDVEPGQGITTVATNLGIKGRNGIPAKAVLNGVELDNFDNKTTEDIEREYEEAISQLSSTGESSRNYTQEAIRNTAEDLADGVDKVYTEQDIKKETTFNGKTAEQLEEEMRGDTSIFDLVDSAREKVKNAGKQAMDGVFDRLTRDKSDESESHYTGSDHYEGIFDEKGTTTLSSSDMHEEYLRRTEKERQEREQQENKNNQQNFGKRFLDQFKKDK